MRKYVVPIAAFAGIALLIPSSHAAELILKSRAIPVGKAGSVPVIVRNVGGSGELWGIDAGLKFSSANVAAVDAANAFAGAGATGTDVVVTGSTFVGGGAQPSLYFGYVRGTSGIAAAGAPLKAAGLLKLKVTAGALRDVYDITAPAYNVKNDGTGADKSRNGISAATSTATAGAAVTNEPITLFTGFLGGAAPSAGEPDLRVPLNKIAVGAPGDITGDGNINAADLGNLAAVVVKKAAASWTDYKKIAADIAPFNGYVAGNASGGTGQSYGDGLVNASDLGLMAAKIVQKPSAANFPIPE
jgi:hypothetical protein